MMNQSRKQKGLEIAGTRKVFQKYGNWHVSSSSGKGWYIVNIKKTTCTCADFETYSEKCKHIYAVEFKILSANNEIHLKSAHETLKNSLDAPIKKTYGQNWAKYNYDLRPV